MPDEKDENVETLLSRLKQKSLVGFGVSFAIVTIVSIIMKAEMKIVGLLLSLTWNMYLTAVLFRSASQLRKTMGIDTPTNQTTIFPMTGSFVLFIYGLAVMIATYKILDRYAITNTLIYAVICFLPLRIVAYYIPSATHKFLSRHKTK